LKLLPFIDPAWMFGTRVMSWAKILSNVFSSSCKPWAHTKTKLSTFLNLETIPIDTTKELKQVANLSPAWSAQALFCSLVMLIDRGPPSCITSRNCYLQNRIELTHQEQSSYSTNFLVQPARLSPLLQALMFFDVFV